MSLIDREGTFMASVADRGIGLSKNGALEFVVNYAIQQERNGSEWVDCEPATIIGHHYVVKTDGTPNAMTIDSIKAAFGWDGQDATTLDTMELPPNHLVQIVVGFETDQQGNDRAKVKFVNPADYSGGVRKASPDERKQIAAKFNSKLRAIAGVPASAPKPKTSPPTSPTAPKAPPAARPPTPKTAPKPASKTATKDQAWEAFVAGMEKLGTSGDKIEAAWSEVIAKQFPGKSDDSMMPEDWGWVATEGVAMAAEIPF